MTRWAFVFLTFLAFHSTTASWEEFFPELPNVFDLFNSLFDGAESDNEDFGSILFRNVQNMFSDVLGNAVKQGVEEAINPLTGIIEALTIELRDSSDDQAFKELADNLIAGVEQMTENFAMGILAGIFAVVALIPPIYPPNLLELVDVFGLVSIDYMNQVEDATSKLIELMERQAENSPLEIAEVVDTLKSTVKETVTPQKSALYEIADFVGAMICEFFKEIDHENPFVTTFFMDSTDILEECARVPYRSTILAELEEELLNY